MPIGDLASVAVLTSLTSGTWTELSAVPTPQEHGFDHLDVEWICDFRGTIKTALQVAAAFPLGMQYGSSDFWLRGGTPERRGGNVWTFKAHYEGRISNTKPLSVRMQSTQEVFSIESLTVSGLFTNAPVNVRECSPSVEISYVLVGSSPPTNLVGLAGSPAVSPAVRSAVWGSLADPRFNYPSGWVFTDVDSDRIAGAKISGTDAEVHYVRESWQNFASQIPA
ncbi:hypothetical protein [Prosthecobacter sp.]|uniref:hypothetical protein n=1 Tax=Prosthecobacter sp. TaxID=1965333 RepID=UPI003784EBF0